MTTRETILAAIATQLASVASGRVYRSRREQLPTLPAVVIEARGARASELALGAMDHELRVSVGVVATGEIPDSAADAVLLAAHTALIADRSLGLGNGITLMPDFEYDPEFEKYDYVMAPHIYTITYRTSGNDF